MSSACWEVTGLDRAAAERACPSARVRRWTGALGPGQSQSASAGKSHRKLWRLLAPCKPRKGAASPLACGSGSGISVWRGSAGVISTHEKWSRETWYGRWYVGTSRVKRRIGPKREAGSRKGLTRAQAEAELRRRIGAEELPASRTDLTVEAAAMRLLRHLETVGRKPTTLDTYRSIFRAQLLEPFGSLALDRVTSEQVERFVVSRGEEGKAPKTISNALTLLFQIFAFAQRKGWCRENPCADVDRPQVEQSTDIRFLDQTELEALLGAVDVSAEPFGLTDRALFLTAAMTGLRQGELLALRWRDIDWEARKVRVRQNHVRGHWGTPKSRRGSRSVPLADRVMRELRSHFDRSHYGGDDELVFAHPQSGGVLDHSALVRRFKNALQDAAVREVRFNDLRHTFGTRMAAAGVPMRTLQEWMGHRDIKTTMIYADYAPSEHESAMVDAAFSQN